MVTLLLNNLGVAISWQYCSTFDVSACEFERMELNRTILTINTFLMIIFLVCYQVTSSLALTDRFLPLVNMDGCLQFLQLLAFIYFAIVLF